MQPLVREPSSGLSAVTRTARAALFAGLVLGGAVTGSVAQDPAPGPQPPKFKHGGDALVQVTFRSASHHEQRRTDESGESVATVHTHDWEVSGLLEVKTHALGAGLLVFTVVGVYGELEGHASETRAWVRKGLAGEGGLSRWEERAQESWSAQKVRKDRFPGAGTIEIDLDRRTWTAPELGDVFDAWPSQLHERERYSAEWHPDPSDETAQPRFSFDKQIRMTGLLGDGPDRPSKRSATELGLQQKLSRANPLTAMVKPKGGADPLLGTAAIEIGQGKNRISASVSWALRRELPELELRVSSPDFERWRPTGDRLPLVEGRLPGNALQLTAELVDPSGAPITGVRIRRMRWWLEDTSRLPGVCLNWPYGSTDTSPDLEFDSSRATDEGQRLEFTDLTTLRKTVRVVPYDFGGWSTLRVEADLDDGRTIRGRRKGQSGDETAIRLPDREPDSRVATSWKLLLHGTGKADDADDETEPEGAGAGDGLTLFEEYRGFYVNGEFDYGDAERKDVIVYDQIGSRSTREASRLFASASGVTWSLHVLRPGQGEMNDSRVINRNRGNGPTRGPQHVVSLRSDARGGMPSATGNRPGRGEVLVPAPELVYRIAPRLRGRRDLYARSIAQAMLALCGVRRPGVSDWGMVSFQAARAEDGAVIVTGGDGTRVQVRDESGKRDLGAEWLRAAERDADVLRRHLRSVHGGERAIEAATKALATRSFYVALRGGIHSGPLANIMRQTFADAYYVPEARTLYVLPPGGDDRVGYSLPSTSEGDGFNAKDHTPRPRFGDSSNPAPRGTFVVNDHAQ